MTRRGDWMQTASGGRFYPLEPTASEVSVEDIAHHLSLLCRFTGACKTFYSVAQHCVYVSDVLEPQRPLMSLHGLLHDAAEAYLGDIGRPLKKCLRELGVDIKGIEQKVQNVILASLRVSDCPDYDSVKAADDAVLAAEVAVLMGPADPGWVLPPAAAVRITRAWGPEEARDRFLDRYERLRSQVRPYGEDL